MNIHFPEELEMDFRLAQFEHLMERRQLLLNSVLLRQNPHNVEEWHKRIKIYEGKPHEVETLFLVQHYSLSILQS